MPVCENCGMTDNACLQIKLTNGYRGIRNKLKGRKKASFCFSCIRTYAKSCLKPNGYWHKIIFPHSHRIETRGGYKRPTKKAKK